MLNNEEPDGHMDGNRSSSDQDRSGGCDVHADGRQFVADLTPAEGEALQDGFGLFNTHFKEKVQPAMESESPVKVGPDVC